MAMTMLEELPRIAFPERQEIAQFCVSMLTLWLRRARTRRQLRGLEKHRLADVGLTETQRRNECAKWFWQK